MNFKGEPQAALRKSCPKTIMQLRVNGRRPDRYQDLEIMAWAYRELSSMLHTNPVHSDPVLSLGECFDYDVYVFIIINIFMNIG